MHSVISNLTWQLDSRRADDRAPVAKRPSTEQSAEGR
jgi:hypothetical protein